MIILYITKDNENVINKEKVYQGKYAIKFKEMVSIISPSIVLRMDNTVNIMVCNYCYIEELKRFYFIQDIELVDNGLLRLQLDCDVLESFKDDILSSVAQVNTTISNGDFLNVSVMSDVRKTIDVYTSDVELLNEKTIVLSTIGVD